jgi:NADPH:quinone reductase-like Zn-dependent oxidoreductase
MLSVNPGTAWLMLTKFVTLQSGDWIVQNASFSGVGHSVVRIAKREGFRTISVVRREEQVDALRRSGGDLVLMNASELAPAVRKATDDAMAKLGLDAVGGDATQQLSDCMADHGTIVSYGLLSGQPCKLSPADVVFRDISLRGFWFSRWQQTASPKEKHDLFARVCRYADEGVIHVPVAATYDIRDAREALRHAATPGKGGKILILPNGPID